MSEQGESNKQGAPKGDGMLLMLYGMLMVGGLALLVMGIMRYLEPGGDAVLLGAGALAVIVPAALYPVASQLASRGRGGASAGEGGDDVVTLLRQLNDRVLVSDAAKRIAYREKDREALRDAIRHDIDKGDFEAALVMVNQMAQVYGYRHEAEKYRSEIEDARAADVKHKVQESIEHLEKLIHVKEWDAALAHAGRTQRMYPGEPALKDLTQRVTEARHRYVQNLEREFLNAANRDEVDRAMALLKELDKYLTEAEGEPLREVARGVVTKARDNLGVQFKLAVHDKEWTRAVNIGEELVRAFPQSRMAEEVRGMLDIMRERAAGEQAARATAAV